MLTPADTGCVFVRFMWCTVCAQIDRCSVVDLLEK